jgi:hypothetical protein
MGAEAAWFDLVEWVEEAPGVRAKVVTIGDARWAVVEYEPGSGRPEWCTEGHHGFVLSGAIHYEFEDGSKPLALTEGHGFLLPSGQGHRGFNHHPETTRLFVIDTA